MQTSNSLLKSKCRKLAISQISNFLSTSSFLPFTVPTYIIILWPLPHSLLKFTNHFIRSCGFLSVALFLYKFLIHQISQSPKNYFCTSQNSTIKTEERNFLCYYFLFYKLLSFLQKNHFWALIKIRVLNKTKN